MRYDAGMTPTFTRLAALCAAFGVTVALSACSSATREDSGARDAAATTSAGPAADHNTDDVMFAQMMIPHHQQAIELAALVPDRSTDPGLVQLAAAIAGQQQPEISAMKAMLVQWEVKPGETLHEGGHGMTMSGMVDEATLIKLEALKGPEFDRLWLTSMIAHHQGAIEMANVEIADGGNADMVGMARGIVAAQQAEIDQMNGMLAGMGDK